MLISWSWGTKRDLVCLVTAAAAQIIQEGSGGKKKSSIHTHTHTHTHKQHKRAGVLAAPATAEWLADWQGHTDFGWVCWASLNPALTGEEGRVGGWEGNARAHSQTRTHTPVGISLPLSHTHRHAKLLLSTNKRAHTHTHTHTHTYTQTHMEKCARAEKPPWLNWFI